MTRIGLIWAEAADGVIGADGGIPWHVPEDFAHFKELTLGSPVIMGRRTWESLPDRFRPLPGRANIVVTRNPDWSADGARRAASLDEALADAGEGRGDADSVWVIGGAELFDQAMNDADVLEVTELDLEVAGDTFAPARDGWRVVTAEPGRDAWSTSRTGTRYRFLRLER
jgi:dihydrofolate reductase